MRLVASMKLYGQLGVPREFPIASSMFHFIGVCMMDMNAGCDVACPYSCISL
uniref:Uncharacterized protein n=1 Tax=Arion vulgaris TaxID=1028688 RepID=A0A0B7B228_9EUPU